MKSKYFLILIISLLSSVQYLRCEISLRGYIKEMPSVMYQYYTDDVSYSNIFHNRINLKYDINDKINFGIESRNRLIYNEYFELFPKGFAEFFSYDDGLVDLSWVWLSENAHIGHTIFDRLYLNYQSENFQVRAGRQRINWGMNIVSNPNDLFNTYSFFDFDYPERPGADAIRIQYFMGTVSRLQLAYKPGKTGSESVAAAMINLNKWDYDMQFLAGYYYDRIAVGLGYAGNILGAGFRGEATWFSDIENNGIERSNLVGAVGFDMMFSNGIFAVIEFLYNGGYERNGNNGLILVTQPLRADNLMFSKYAATLSGQYSISGLANCGFAIMVLPDIESYFISPNFSYSVAENFDLELIAQYFDGLQVSLGGSSTISVFFSIKYNY